MNIINFNIIIYYYYNYRTRRITFYFDYECAASLDDKHFLQNPIQLDCSHCVCKICIGKHESIKCIFCGQTTNKSFIDFDVSLIKKSEMMNNFDELFNETKERFKACFEEYKGY